MKYRALTLLAVLGVAFAAAGLLFAGAADASGHSATRTISPASVETGGTVTVSIAVSDLGLAGKITETLPAGFTFVSSSVTVDDDDISGQDVNFILFGQTSFSYTVTASDTAGDYSFSGVVLDDQKDSRTIGGDTDITVTSTAVPTATRSFSSASVQTGAEITVTVAASDYGDTGSITETLPVGFSHVAGSGGTATGQTVNLGLTSAGQTVTYKVTAAPTAETYTFSGTLTASDGSTATVGGSSSVTVTAPPTGPSATRSFSPSTVARGGTLTVSVSAAGFGDFGSVTETLPEGFTFVSSTPADISTVSGRNVNFVLFGANSFSYTVTASSVPGTHAFSGTMQTDDDTEVTVSGASRVTVSGPTATRSFATASVIPDGQLRVTVSAKNYGEAGLVTETLPSGFEFVSVTPSGIAVEHGRNVEFVLVGPNQSFTYTVDAPDREDTYTFSGTLTDINDEEFNVRGKQTIDVAVAPPTSLRSIADSQIKVGEETTVTVLALNYGLAATLTENLPDGLDYVSTTNDAIVVNGKTLTWTLVGDNQSVTYTVEATARGDQDISGHLLSFDKQLALTGGAARINVIPATPPTSPGGPYTPPPTPVPTETPVPTATPVPPTATPVPPTATPVPPTATPVPPTATPVPPTATPVPPTATPVPPTATPVPPTATPQPTATPVPPTATPVPPTATPQPTATPVPPTATPVPPTATPVPPTATPVPPTATPQPTATPVPPTATPVPPPPPTATPVPPPEPTATPVPPPPEPEDRGFPVWAIILIILAILAAIGGGLAYIRYYRARQLEA